MNNRTRTLFLIEAINVCGWANQLSEEKLNKIDFKIRWALKKTIAKLLPDVQEFEKMREEEFKKIQLKYAGDDKSIETIENVKDEKGNDVLDENGNIKTNTLRKVKPEFLEEYNAEIASLNTKLNEVLMEKNTYEFATADVDAFVNSLDDLAPLEFSDLEMLQAILGEDNGEAK